MHGGTLSSVIKFHLYWASHTISPVHHLLLALCLYTSLYWRVRLYGTYCNNKQRFISSPMHIICHAFMTHCLHLHCIGTNYLGDCCPSCIYFHLQIGRKYQWGLSKKSPSLKLSVFPDQILNLCVHGLFISLWRIHFSVSPIRRDICPLMEKSQRVALHPSKFRVIPSYSAAFTNKSSCVIYRVQSVVKTMLCREGSCRGFAGDC